MRTLFRTPWPTLAIGGTLAVTALAVNIVRYDAQKGPEGHIIAVVLALGILLMTVSLALMEATDTRDAARRWKKGFRLVVAYLAVMFLRPGSLLLLPLGPFMGGVGSPSRWTFALVCGVINLALPFLLAPWLAEQIRRAAAWLGDERSA